MFSVASLESPSSVQQVRMFKLCDRTTTLGAMIHLLRANTATSRIRVCPQYWVSNETSGAGKHYDKLERVNQWNGNDSEASEGSILSKYFIFKINSEIAISQ